MGGCPGEIVAPGMEQGIRNSVMNRSNSTSVGFTVSLLAALVAGFSAQAAAQSNEDDTTELEPIVVSGEREGPVGPDYGYKADRSLTATKTDTPLSETPRSVSVATRDQIEDRGSRNLTDILQYMPGVTPSPQTGGDTHAADVFNIRGMNQRDYGYGTYRDGLRLQPNAYSTSAEPYGLERVEVLKGPTSILYGENAPGGLVNLVSKRPTDTPQGEVNLGYGTHERKEVSADVSGPLTEDGSVKGRLVFLRRQANTQTESVPDDRVYFAPSITFELSDRDTLTLLTMYQQDNTEIQLALPAAGTLLDHPGGELETDANLGHPEWDNFDREVWSFGWEYEHEFNNAWSFRQNARYLRSRVDRQETWRDFAVILGQTLDVTPAQLQLLVNNYPSLAPLGTDGFASAQLAYGLDRFNESRTYAIDNQIVGDFKSGELDNTLLLGAAFDQTSFEQTVDSSAFPSVDFTNPAAPLQLNEFQLVDIFNPQYMNAPQTSSPQSDSDADQQMVGVYSQIQTRYRNLIGLLGARFDSVDTEYKDTVSGVDEDGSDDELTWQAGLMYEFDFGLSPYANYATSFIPAAREAAEDTGRPLEPVTGDQYEVGFKYQPPGSQVAMTVAYFDLTRENDIVFDDAVGGYRQVGETESRGVEFEVVGDVTDNISVTAAYTYLDTEVTDDGGSRTEGRRSAGIPYHQAALWTNYEFHSGALSGLETGLGIRYLGSTKAYPDPVLGYGNELETDAQALVDLAVAYGFAENWRVGVTAKNVFDKEYVASCTNGGGCYWGAERTVQATLSYNY